MLKYIPKNKYKFFLKIAENLKSEMKIPSNNLFEGGMIIDTTNFHYALIIAYENEFNLKDLYYSEDNNQIILVEDPESFNKSQIEDYDCEPLEFHKVVR